MKSEIFIGAIVRSLGHEMLLSFILLPLKFWLQMIINVFQNFICCPLDHATIVIAQFVPLAMPLPQLSLVQDQRQSIYSTNGLFLGQLSFGSIPIS